jgi:phospholipid-binding lipoprotein MlaA
MTLHRHRARTALLLAAASGLGACATTGRGPDPYEGFNRAMFGANRAVDRAVVRPGAVVYRTVTPVPARRGLSRVLENLTEPWSAINALLQGKPRRAANALGRFVINTTIGVGGLADHATGLGLKPTREDFGQTLATWGVKDGGYLVLPLFGPSTVRDGVGIGVGMVADPQNVAISQIVNPRPIESAAIGVARAISARSDFMESGAEEVLNTSADPYAAARSAYFQRRAVAIADRENATPNDETDLDAALKAIDAAPPTPQPQENQP